MNVMNCDIKLTAFYLLLPCGCVCASVCAFLSLSTSVYVSVTSCKCACICAYGYLHDWTPPRASSSKCLQGERAYRS